MQAGSNFLRASRGCVESFHAFFPVKNALKLVFNIFYVSFHLNEPHIASLLGFKEWLSSSACSDLGIGKVSMWVHIGELDTECEGSEGRSGDKRELPFPFLLIIIFNS